MELLFWITACIILYTYIGYGVLLFFLSHLLQWVSPRKQKPGEISIPSLTVVVTAYNEVDCIEEKIQNTLGLNYPQNKIHFIFVTDGSDDGTEEIVARFPLIKLLHDPVRRGKISAMHRAMQEITTEIVVFTDANTIINRDALLQICRHYSDERTGAVAGEKRIDISHITDAVSGEGIYWQYESALKKYESALYSVIGAAGELFSIRTALYQPVRSDTIQDDFMISMQIAQKGYRIRYEPAAYTTEKATVSIAEERKRRIRIAVGGIQAMIRLPGLLNPFSQPLLWFEYTSHRILRWVIAPYALVLCFIINTWLVCQEPVSVTVYLLEYFQVLFYATALIGWLYQTKELKFRLFFVPYYFCLMNYGMIEGMVRYLLGRQTVIWEKAARR